MKRPFAELDPQQALHIAIFIEQRNAELYHRFAEMFAEFSEPESLEISEVFWEMATEERLHSSMLQARYAEQYGDSRCTLTEEDLQEWIEVPRLQDADLLDVDTTNGSPRGRALEVALKAEIGAQSFYAQLTENTKPGELRNLYRDLAEMEDGHVNFLRRKLAAATAAAAASIN